MGFFIYLILINKYSGANTTFYSWDLCKWSSNTGRI